MMSQRRMVGLLTSVILAASGLCRVASLAAFAGERLLLPGEPASVPALADVRWVAGFWKERQDVCFENSLPAMSQLMKGTQRSQFLHNFRIAAGQSAGQHRGPDWNDGDTFKWLEACCAAFALTGDASLRREIDAAVALIAAAQRADGYLHTPVLIAIRNGDATARPFGDPVDFEMYNFGHLMTAAVVHHEATGRRELLDVARRAADFLDREFAVPDADRARHAMCPAHGMGIIDLYRVTREKRYLDLAGRWLAMRDLVEGGGDDNQDRLPFREQREMAGHAVRANYLYAGVADLCLETRDSTLLPTLQACWQDLVDRKVYITGGCGALYDGASPDGSDQQKTITRVHQAYGRNYQLPNSTAHNETCAAVGSVLWSHRMLQLTGESRYADLLETTLLNAVLAGVSLDGRRYFYTNTLRQLDTMPTPLRWSRERQEWISCYCCPPNVVRLLAQSSRYAWLTGRDSLTTVLYGSSELQTRLSDGSALHVAQTTDYPWDGRIRFDIREAPPREYRIRLRIPAWCESAKLMINGEGSPIRVMSGSFVEVRRHWQPQDVIELELDMPAQLVEAHPLVEECRGQVAVRRGPLVYCLESTDLPAHVSVLNISVRADEPFEMEHADDMLGRVTRLTANLCVVEPVDREAAGLYRSLRQTKETRLKASLIPYFAWGNRGRSEMTVWLPLRF